MKRIVILCVLWLACASNFFESSSAIARSRLIRTITGKVIDDQTKHPLVAKLKVSVDGFSPGEVTTDSLGHFSVSIPDVSTCSIIVSANGFDQKEETIEISESTSNYLEIALTPSVKLTLEGNVFGGTSDDERKLDATLIVYVNSDFIKEDSVVAFNGRYSESFTNFGWYLIDFSAPGYADATDTIWVMNSDRKTIHKDYHLVPLDSKLPTTMNNIHFDFDRSALNPECYTELNYLAQFLKHNLSKQVEIIGHTDNTGPKEYNLILSQARAQAVVSYLVSKGVAKEQLIAKGYGEQTPIDSNNTLAGKAKNRRVELVVLEKLTSENEISKLNSIQGQTH